MNNFADVFLLLPTCPNALNMNLLYYIILYYIIILRLVNLT